MRTSIWAGALLMLLVGGPAACAQTKAPDAHSFHLSAIDLAVTYSAERAGVTPQGAGAFWIRGGSAEAALTFYRGFGVAAVFTGGHASNLAPGVNLGTLSVMAGPRYTLSLRAKHPSRLFAEALFGGVHAYDGVFPSSTGVTPHANAFSMQMGGGWDLALTKHFAVRPIEIDYLRTSLPNNGSNTQNYLRLGFGVVYHIPFP